MAHLTEFRPFSGLKVLRPTSIGRVLSGNGFVSRKKKTLLVWPGPYFCCARLFDGKSRVPPFFLFFFFWLGDNVPSWGLACPGQAQHWPPIYKTRLFAARLPHTTNDRHPPPRFSFSQPSPWPTLIPAVTLPLPSRLPTAWYSAGGKEKQKGESVCFHA